MTFIIGAVAVYYSVSLFLASPNQTSNPQSFKVSHWSGYIVASDIQNRSPVVSSVSASWTVPEIKPSENNTFSGVWVGIGGYGEDTLIQTGTEQEYINGKSVYYAWYELLPDYLVRIPKIHVQAGDTITASISLVSENTNTWLIEIADVTRGQRFKETFVYNSSRLSAEWVVERPKVNGSISTLADFGNVTFTECKATIDGVAGTIGNFSYAQLVMHDEELQLVTVSPLNDDGSSFTVSYLELPSASPLSYNLAVHTLPHDFCNPHQLVSANRKIEIRKSFEGVSNRLMLIS
ncbi:MAG: hypothetical protein FJ045_03590 [Crenarchaeota archaeon]|nr:hypothetical protein [Thermoproteota archaeon]